MNTDNFVWNMRIAKKFMKGKLNLMLDGFDILNNLSNIRRTINAQGFQKHGICQFLAMPCFMSYTDSTKRPKRNKNHTPANSDN